MSAAGAPASVRVPPVPAGFSGYSVPSARSRRGSRNRSAWWSFGLGLLSLTVGTLVLIDQQVTFWISTSGVFAIISGVQALRLRAQGYADALVPAVIGVAAGAIGTLIMVVMLLVPVHSGGVDPDSSGAAGAAGAPAGTSLDANPPSVLPDDALNSYVTADVTSVTPASAGCGVLSADLTALPAGFTGTEAKRTQEFISLQAQPMAEALRDAAKAKRAWPSSLDLDPQTHTLYIGKPSCLVLGAVPKGAEVRYGLSPDRGQSALAVYDPTVKVGTVWRSVDDTQYWL